MMTGQPVLLAVAFTAALALASQPPAASAQRSSGEGTAATGSVVGVVRDSAGAVVAGISVRLHSERASEGSSQVAVTDAAGTFRFDGLPAGPYRLEISVPRFSRFVRPGLAVGSGQGVRLEVVLTDRSATPPRATLSRPPPVIPAPAPPPPVLQPAPAGQAPAPVQPPGAADSGEAIIPVFYATDRSREAGTTIDYGSARASNGALALGRFDVSIPRDHQMGTVERPTIWTLYQERPASHFVITKRTQHTYQGFYDDVRSVVTRSTRKDAFVFVHGFNVAFVDAVMRTAQIAYDLGFDGAPILYSWPSNTGENPIGYTAAQNNNDWTAAHLEWFLRDVTTKTGAQRVHLIAHSMGNRALVNALNRLPPTTPRPFNQIVLTAPDMDADTFVELAAAVARNAERTTLYASGSDIALTISKRLNAYRRAGDTRPAVLVVRGIDTVDVTAVDSNFVGHYYYGDNRSVISDVFLLLTKGLGPYDRPMLQGVGRPPRFWRFAR